MDASPGPRTPAPASAPATEPSGGSATTGPTDLELLRAAARGDERSFHVLMDRHAAGLFRLAQSLSGTRADAEDICQETFAGAFQSMARFDGRASVKTWLTKILIRRAAKLWHKDKQRRRSVSIDQDHAASNGDPNGTAGTTGPLAMSLSVPSATSAVDHRLDVLAVIRTLTPEHRDVIVLRVLEGLSYEEIAQALSVPRGTVESRLHRARAELRRRLEGYEF